MDARSQVRHFELRFMGGSECEGADLGLGQGIVLELAREPNGCWGIWAVKIDGHRYFEPRDLTAEPLRHGDFRDWIEQRYDEYAAARRKVPTDG